MITAKNTMEYKIMDDKEIEEICEQIEDQFYQDSQFEVEDNKVFIRTYPDIPTLTEEYMKENGIDMSNKQEILDNLPDEETMVEMAVDQYVIDHDPSDRCYDED